MRTHVYKNKILSVFKGKHLLSIADIHAHVPEADYSTVFRNVERLSEEGFIKKVVVDKGVVKYELTERHSHDHFVCTKCGTVDAIAVEHTMLAIDDRARVTDVVVRGVCSSCDHSNAPS